MSRDIAVVNVGASTLKLALLEVTGDHAVETQRIERDRPAGEDVETTLRAAFADLERAPDAFGHRVVHGGADFVEPRTLTETVELELADLVSLAPLHNGPALKAIRHVRRAWPGLPSVAVFDTAFHADRPAKSRRYALPRELVDRFGFERYGFHGFAHASLAAGLADAQGTELAEVDAVTLQLGAGCSACAVRGGRSIETSMGYTPLEGLVMATRCGNVDPAIVLKLIRAGYPADRIEDELGRRSGLRGLCGMSDVREILAAGEQGDDDARFALELFCDRIIQTVGASLTLLDGVGALVFGGGIGTNSPEIRRRIAQGLRCWNVSLDEDANAKNVPGRISAADSRPVFALETDEEAVIARDVYRHLAACRP